MSSIAIMQPYWFPYIGYFQLIQSVETFVFYDDVNYIKSGWINRNRVLIEGKPQYVTLSVQDASSFRKINETKLIKRDNKLERTIEQAYRRAPYFVDVYPMIADHLKKDFESVSDAAISSIEMVFKYLQLEKKFQISSQQYADTYDLSREERLIKICQLSSSSIYINPAGGSELYSKDNFQKQGIALKLLEPGILQYPQFKYTFVPGLSIIDVLMFNSKYTVKSMVDSYTLG